MIQMMILMMILTMMIQMMFKINNYIYFVPLWHNELVFDNNDGGIDNIIVKCVPCLPENISIDDNNNLIINLDYPINSNTFSFFDQENIQMLHDNENAVFNHCLLALEKEEKQLHEKELKTHEKDHKNHQGQPLQRAARYTTSPFSKNQTTKLILGQQLLRTKQRLAERKQEEVKKEEEEEKRKHAIAIYQRRYIKKRIPEVYN